MQKKIILLFLLVLFPNSLLAQDGTERSGIYEELSLAVDSSSGVLTGYYKNATSWSEDAFSPHFTCHLFITGKQVGDKYAIQAWVPTEKNPTVTSGEVRFLPPKKEKSHPSVSLALSPLPGDCWSVDPNLGKAQGAKLGLDKAEPWIEVRVASGGKTHFYDSPSEGAEHKDYALRGSVLTVLEKKSGWNRVAFDGKVKGWVQEEDLFALAPIYGTKLKTAKFSTKAEEKVELNAK